MKYKTKSNARIATASFKSKNDHFKPNEEYEKLNRKSFFLSDQQLSLKQELEEKVSSQIHNSHCKTKNAKY